MNFYAVSKLIYIHMNFIYMHTYIYIYIDRLIKIQKSDVIIHCLSRVVAKWICSVVIDNLVIDIRMITLVLLIYIYNNIYNSFYSDAHVLRFFSQ